MLDPRSCRRLVIYGGTFDPPHGAHTTLPFVAADRIDADGVMYVPGGQPPHKSPEYAAAEHRLAMLRLALGDREDAAICTWELEQTGPTYTCRTLEHLRDELGLAVELRLLIGADMALIFDTWRHAEQVAAAAEPLVMLRPPYDRQRLLAELPADQRDRWADRLTDVPAIDVSSSALRQRLEAGQYDDRLVVEMLAPSVLDYIRCRELYRSPR
jgi:nicotinate-nucleotide adenylyltransferase